MRNLLTCCNAAKTVNEIEEYRSILMDAVANSQYDKTVKHKMHVEIAAMTSVKYARKWHANAIVCMHTPGKQPRYVNKDREEFFQVREDNHIETINRPQLMPFGGHNWLNTTLKKDRKIEFTT